MRLVRLLLLPTLVAMNSCASQPTYVRWINQRNVSQEQFMKDRYDCLRETQQRVSSASVDAYGGQSSSQVMPSCSAWHACLAARGYFRNDTTSLDDFKLPGSLYVPQGALVYCR